MTMMVPEDWVPPKCARCGAEWPKSEVWKIGAAEWRLICPRCYENEQRAKLTAGFSRTSARSRTLG